MELVENEFDKGQTVTLSALYAKLADPETGVTSSKTKHYVRSVLDHMRKTGKIVWIARSTYKKKEA